MNKPDINNARKVIRGNLDALVRALLSGCPDIRRNRYCYVKWGEGLTGQKAVLPFAQVTCGGVKP